VNAGDFASIRIAYRMSAIMSGEAHAPRVLAMAPSPSRTSLDRTKTVLARVPKPAREARALPGF